MLRELAGTSACSAQRRNRAGAGKARHRRWIDCKLTGTLDHAACRGPQGQNFALSDQIRDRLAALGVTLEDRPDGTGWTIAEIAVVGRPVISSQ